MPPPIALYIHWPFCLAKCPYCDFNSHVRAAVEPRRWREALLADMAHEAAVTGPRTVSSIFFGGGTPSLMPPSLVADLIEEAARLWVLSEDCEITLEANPSSVETGNFAALAQAGVNRVSLGVQAFHDDVLRRLGRLHDADEARAAIEVAQVNFARVSFDLIYARPEQTEAAWEAELRDALAFGTDHLSLYQLTIEPGTRFATDVRRGVLTPLDDDAAATLYDLTAAITTDAGLPPYEISNHARPGSESRHNLTYWRYGDYVGIGPGAHGRRGGLATERHRKPENYLAAVDANGHGISLERPLPPRESAEEAVMMGLRLAEGIDPVAVAARFGMSVDSLINGERVALYERQGLLRRDSARLMVTKSGMPLLDALLGELIALTPVEP